MQEFKRLQLPRELCIIVYMVVLCRREAVKIESIVLEIEGVNHVYKEMAILIGLDNAHKIYEYFSGQQITFPVKWYSPEYVAEMVLKRYDGRNLKYLAKEYNYSERWLRQLIKNQASENNKNDDTDSLE